MRRTVFFFAAGLLALALGGCMESQSAYTPDPSFACPSGNCVGMNSARGIGGNPAD